MWICTNQGFLSIVNSNRDPSVLMVRARRPGDLEAIFGHGTQVTTLPGRDYQFRVLIKREVVGQVIAKALVDISYCNFKASVRDKNLADAYHDVWDIMQELQPVKPYGHSERPGFRKHPIR